MSFLHGVETIEYQAGATTIQTVATAIIGLVGTAPVQNVAAGNQTVNTPVLIASSTDAANYFGQDTPGYTIPAALKAILDSGEGPVIVVNVFDPANPAHQTGGLPDPSKVGAADVIGTTLASGQRTGLLALLDAKSTYGLVPKQLEAPGFTTLAGVSAQMDTVATKLRAICWVDAPVGLTPAQAIAARGTYINFASKRTVICYPNVKAVNGQGVTQLYPLSQFSCAACAAKDKAKGYWWSPSNTTMPGVTGLERPIDGDFRDQGSDLNLLNGAGLLTVYAGYGTGYLLWGNRSSAFPGSNDVDTFIAVRRTADIIEESIEQASLKYMDWPITNALVDLLLDDCNEFIRTLIGRGAIVEGKAFFNASKNPASQLAAGQLVISYKFLPPAPLERLTYEATVDISLYSAVSTNNGNATIG